ncbi:MAG: integrin alpha, partial [Acidobacteria bacterium]|nr:integrin alpha [Acidobacteriota bacterium]
GFSDLLVGANRVNVGAPRDAGRADHIRGGPTGPAWPPAWTFDGGNSNASLGRSVATAGDVNGDGFSDVLVGAPDATVTKTYEGQALLFLGGASGLATAPAWSVAGGVLYADLGTSVASAGDVNGDGFADPLVGDPDAAEIGAAHLYYGGGTAGLPLRPTQQRTDGTPMAPLDLALGDAAYDALVLGRTPAGRGRVQLRVETRPLGAPFDGSGSVSGALTPTGSPGSGGSTVPLAVRTSALTVPGPYVWRARVTSANPLFPGSRWLSLPGNGPRETDFRTTCGTATTWYRDADGDGFGDPLGPQIVDCVQPFGYAANGLDCNDADAMAHAAPSEVVALEVARRPAAVRISWASQDAAAGNGTAYDLAGGDVAALRSNGGFGAAVCLADDVPDTPYDDARPDPAAGAADYFLVRAQNGCGTGTHGDSGLAPDPRDALDAGGPCP